MSVTTTAVQLRAQIGKLQGERQEYVKAIAEIDSVFEQFGIKAEGPARRGRPLGSANRQAAPSVGQKRGPKPGLKQGPQPGLKTRSEAAQPPAATAAAPKKTGSRLTGPELLKSIMRSKGSTGATSSELSKAWTKDGRKGNVYAVLGGMVEEGAVRRKSLQGQKGSVFSLQ